MRIKDASSLVLVDRRSDQPRLLMGRRSAQHKFMPSVYVFPGGRVDYADRFAPFGHDYKAETLDLLLQQMKGRPTALRARMLGLAAIRETFEEVGLMLGSASDVLSGYTQPSWNSFGEANLIPDLSRLTYIARAITPPGNSRRFDTRFFLSDAGDYLNHQNARSSDELEEVQWVTFEEAQALPTHFITKQILATAKMALNHKDFGHKALTIPFYQAKPGASDVAKTVTYLRFGKPPLKGKPLLVKKT